MERERERERERGREREREREKEREFLFLKGMTGALAPFSNLVHYSMSRTKFIDPCPANPITYLVAKSVTTVPEKQLRSS
jgi:hypothetical protein